MRRNSSDITISTSGVRYKRPKKKQKTHDEIEALKDEYSVNEHLLTIRELERRYMTSAKTGLTQEMAAQLLEDMGPNLMVAPPSKNRWIILADFIFCGFAALLWFAGILSTIGFILSYQKGEPQYEQLYLACILSVVNFITGIFGFYQESANVAIMESFQKLTPKMATVIRDGVAMVVPCEELVLGDLVDLKGGEWVPADVRVVESKGLKVDNSAITGESLPQVRSVDKTNDNPLETANLAFYSTSVLEGSGKGIIINVGDATLIGHIAGLTSNLEKSETPIRREINFFIKVITSMSLIIGALFFILCMVLQHDFFETFGYFIAIVIGNVPEGLPVTMTACMTLTAKRMASKNCLVKKLEAIETLGCCNVICSDKTGTLTQNKMKVVHLYYDNQPYYVLNIDKDLNRNSAAFEALCLVASLCSNATFIIGQEHVAIDERKVIGDASETGILKCMEIIKGNVLKTRQEYPKVCEIPFNSTNKYQVSIHKHPTNKFILMMKGAPERVLDHCSTILTGDKSVPFTFDIRRKIKTAINKLGNDGERVLAFADLELNFEKDFEFDEENINFPLQGLRFVGLISLMDPPRATVPDAVQKCRSAGIRVVMVTGDHPITAAAIARQVGIISSDSLTAYDIALKRDVSVSLVSDKEKNQCNAAVFTGSDLREMSEEELQKNLVQFREIVFARTSPQQKLKIVEAFQRMNKIVAVTGDGVNDAPALKKADIGVAMGISGSDVSKEAADIILLDDNFASIVVGIEEGRLIFDNLKKSIAYLLTSNIPEIIPFVILVTFNIPPMLSVIAVIVIDVGTDLWPAISLAYEKPEADIMLRRPRNPKYDKLVNHRLIFLCYFQIGVIQTCAGFSSYCCLLAQNGFLLEKLPNLYADWVDANQNVTDSYGQVWQFKERQMLTKACYSTFFLSIVMTQVTDLLICKTRRLSLFRQGMTNWVLNAGMVFEACLAIFLVYCPVINTAFQFIPIDGHSLLTTVPMALFIIVYDEIRKAIIRSHPDGIVDRETYY